MTNEKNFLRNLAKLYPKIEEAWSLLYTSLNDFDIPEFGPYETLSSATVEVFDYVKSAEKEMYFLLMQLDDLNNKVKFMEEPLKKGKNND
jgi:hypothetical protein